MRTEIHSLLTDIKAAARIGHAESLWAALDGLFDLPEVAGNPPMSEVFLTQAILPIGEALSHPRLKVATLRPLVNQPHAAIRAIAAVSLVRRFFRQGKVSLKDLRSLGKDPRRDVRAALAMAFAKVGEEDPQRLGEAVESWISSDSPRLRSVALRMIPTLAERDTPKVLKILGGFDASSDPEERTALVKSLVKLAQDGLADEVLKLLGKWAEEPEANLRVVSKTLSRSWAAAHAGSSMEILTCLAAHFGPKKQITQALQALLRHGADEDIQEALRSWRNSEDLNLRAAAEKISSKSKTQ